MPASAKHLDHLSTILNESGNLKQHYPISEKNLRVFFDAIALDRVRISRTDWQGHPVHTMIGHLPNLKPAGKASLSKFIVDKWNARAAGETIPLSPKGTAVSVPPRKCTAEKELTTATVEKNNSATPQLPPGFPSIPVPHRDGFDRITDWVAALVSLWK